MGFRNVYGNSHSENGWPMVDQGSCRWIVVPGSDDVNLQIQTGIPEILLKAFAADYNEHVEKLRDRDSACWTPTNSVSTSNHLSGTAMDLNWDGPDGKTFRLGIPQDRAYPPPKDAALAELLAYYEDIIFCGGFWSIRDWMHFQVGYNTFGPNNDSKVNDFIRRKIRSDGFSKYKRDGVVLVPPVVPVTPPTPDLSQDAVQVLAAAIGVNEATATELLLDIRFGLIQSECNTVLRIAHWLAQMGHESAGWVATEEYQNGNEAEDRWKYKGRTWIQITWRANYEKFGYWLKDKNLIDDPLFFVNNPKVLAAKKWRAIGPAWYWTETRRETRKYPTCNEAADNDDLITVTQIINGGTNGLVDRQNRYNRAIALGDRLLAIIGGDVEVADTTTTRLIQEIHACLFSPLASQSIYRDVNEQPHWRLWELIKNDDGMTHQRHVEYSAKLGNLTELGRIIKVARGQGAITEPWAVTHCTAVLAEIERDNPEAIHAYLAWEAENRRALR